MTITVIYALEVISIDHENREGPRITLRHHKGVFRNLFESMSIQCTCQIIRDCKFAQFILDSLALGDIPNHTDMDTILTDKGLADRNLYGKLLPTLPAAGNLPTFRHHS